MSEEKEIPSQAVGAESPEATAVSVEAGQPAPADAALPDAAPPVVAASPAAAPAVRVLPRWRRWAPDLLKTALALAVVGVAAMIWYQPPLVSAKFPYVSYRFEGRWAEDAVLYRPLAMPTRYYVALPQKLAGRYEWFAVDRRREVVALTEAPHRRGGTGGMAIRRSDPLGLDLEFRKLDGSEWLIHFTDNAIVFSNALLIVRMDTKKENSGQ
jgi:hypothetical protein